MFVILVFSRRGVFVGMEFGQFPAEDRRVVAGIHDGRKTWCSLQTTVGCLMGVWRFFPANRKMISDGPGQDPY